MTNGNDFAFSDTAVRMVSLKEGKVTANNPPLTKREYFAAMAMQGLLASMTEAAAIGRWGCDPDAKAEASVSLADELITALNNNPC